MQSQTFVFLGPQGSGKGTQADQLAEFLRTDLDHEVLHFETGAAFRDLAKLDTETGRRVKQSMNEGHIQPSFLATRLWADGFAHDLHAGMHLIVDGSPRTLLEARMLDDAFSFYQRTPVKVIHLTLPREETYKRLAERSRDDDYRQAIEYRLDEYEEKTLPVVDFYKDSDNYQHIEIDGQQSIADIQQEIRDTVLPL